MKQDGWYVGDKIPEGTAHCGTPTTKTQLLGNTVLMSSNIALNSVRQHNYFITQGNYVGYMFRLLFSDLQAYFVN